MKIYNKRELQNITINHSADMDYKDYKRTLFFFTIDITLTANNPMRFRKNFSSSPL